MASETVCCRGYREKKMDELKVSSLPEIPLSEQANAATVFSG
jgi:hypothetical protein